MLEHTKSYMTGYINKQNITDSANEDCETRSPMSTAKETVNQYIGKG